MKTTELPTLAVTESIESTKRSAGDPSTNIDDTMVSATKW